MATASRITVPDAVERYIDLRRFNSLSVSAIALDQTVLRRFARTVGGIQMRSLTHDHVADPGYDGALRSTSALLHHADSSTTEDYLGLTRETKRRDETLQGKPFLTAIAAEQDNVVPIKRRSTEADAQ